MKTHVSCFILVSLIIASSCEKARLKYPWDGSGDSIYSNSFESQSDLSGWNGYAYSLAAEAPRQGGKQSLSVSGGCIIPHAEYTVKPQSTDCYVALRFWGRNINGGGVVYLNVNKEGGEEIGIEVKNNSWTHYESKDTIFCPANTSLTLGIISGGIISGQILVDLIEIIRLDDSQ